MSYLCTAIEKSSTRPDGGIGRRAGLKHQWIHFHPGSTPGLGTEAEKVEKLSPFFFSTPRNSLVCWAQRPIPSNRNLHKLLRVIFPEVLMEYFEISCWHDDFMKNTTWNVQITRVEL